MSNPNVANYGKSTRFSSERQPAIPGGTYKKGSKHLSTWIQELLNDENFEILLEDPREGWKKFDGLPVKALVKTALIRASAGDAKWADWLAKYGYGSKLQLSNDPDNPVGAKQLTDEEIVDRYNQIIQRGQAGTERISGGDGSSPSS